MAMKARYLASPSWWKAYLMARFLPSHLYWPARYNTGGISGPGSRGRLAQFKARVLNDFVAKNGIGSVIEFGCGNGDQLSLARYPRYVGVDISRTALAQCRARFAGDDTKTFVLLRDHRGGVHDLAISLDVIFHLVEDSGFNQHMESLFSSARRFVIIYSSNHDDLNWAFHIRHRSHSRWVEANRPDWKLVSSVPNEFPLDAAGSDDTSFADFYVYARRTT